MRVSVCTISRDRGEQLTNLVLGLRRSKRPPCDVVIGVMQNRPYDLPLASFPVRQVVLGDQGLQVARARNAAARRASGELLVFLDADCIPAPDALDAFAAAAPRGGLLMGDVAYLPPEAADAGLDFSSFEKVAVRGKERASPPATSRGETVTPSRDFRSFHGDYFAISAQDFSRVGGFDEAYQEMGAEDVDFARAAMSAGLPLAWVRGALAFHQHHPQAMPPVGQLDAVLANAALFRRKWNQPVMEEWLRAFALMGLVEQAQDGSWRKLREAGPEDVALAERQARMPYASSAEVIDQLERLADPQQPGPLRPAA